MRPSTVALAFWALLSSQAATAGTLEAPLPMHVVVMPVQEALKGPDPDDSSLSGLTELLWLAGPTGALLGGAISAVDYSRARGAEGQQSFITAFDRDFFDFRHAILDGIEDLALDPGVRITQVHEHDFENAENATVRWLYKNLGAKHVLLVDPTYYVSPGLDQARLRIRLAYYRANPDRRPQDRIFRRHYEYLSTSRGDLMRPWRQGEKEALVAAVERQFAEKSSRYPKNRKAYEKARRDMLAALAESERLLPGMALNEGWPGDTLAAELGEATSSLMRLIESDLRDLSAQPPADAEYVEFEALKPGGESATFEGYVIGTRGSRTAYRDADGNVYSVPQPAIQ